MANALSLQQYDVIGPSAQAKRPYKLFLRTLTFCLITTYIILIIGMGVHLLPSTKVTQSQAIFNTYHIDDRIACLAAYHLPITPSYKACKRSLITAGAGNAPLESIVLSLSLSLILSYWLASIIAQPPSRKEHVRGRHLLRGANAVHYLRTQSNLKQKIPPLWLTKYFSITLKQESEHSIAVGGSGSGKTQLHIRMIAQGLARGDRMIIHDTKGDYTKHLPGAPILSPTDARSSIWDISADIRDLAQAQELAAYLIPVPDKQPLWAQGARSILSAHLVRLMTERPSDWDWGDIAGIISMPVEIHRATAQTYYKEALQFINTPPQTQAGFTAELASQLKFVTQLANAWQYEEGRTKISLREWLHKPENQPQAILMVRSAEHSELTQSWIGAALNFLSKLSVSNALPDDLDRRVRLYLDEFPALNKQEGITDIIRQGRSKGIVVHIGVQSIDALHDLYGKSVIDDWMNSIGLRFIGKHKNAESARRIVTYIGQREVERAEVSHTMRGDDVSQNLSWRKDNEDLLLPSQLDTELGHFSDGDGPGILKLLVLGVGAHVAQFSMPVIPLKTTAKTRDTFEPAKWLQGSDYKQAHEFIPQKTHVTSGSAPHMKRPTARGKEPTPGKRGQQERRNPDPKTRFSDRAPAAEPHPAPTAAAPSAARSRARRDRAFSDPAPSSAPSGTRSASPTAARADALPPTHQKHAVKDILGSNYSPATAAGDKQHTLEEQYGKPAQGTMQRADSSTEKRASKRLKPQLRVRAQTRSNRQKNIADRQR